MTDSYINRLRTMLAASIRAKQALLDDPVRLGTFAAAAAAVVDAYEKGGRLYIAGNGGSAADAQHLAAEFISKLARSRAPLPAEALTVDSSIITAVANDYGFEQVFARQLAGKMRPGDMFLAITTSGSSPNILAALTQCRSLGNTSILFSGRDGGPAAALADHCVFAYGEDTSTIQETHILLAHALCAAVEDALFPS